VVEWGVLSDGLLLLKTPQNTEKVRDKICQVTKKTVNSSGSEPVFIRISGFKPNPIKYTDPDGKITQSDHFSRNRNQNGYAPANQDRMDKLVEMKLFSNKGNTGTHNLKPNEDNPQGRWAAFTGGKKGTNIDYRGAVGTIFEGMQFIYDSNGDLVLDSINKGTFDTISPDSNGLGHFLADVKPWLDWGNGPPDNYQDVVMPEEKWNKIDNIYSRFSNGEITQEQASKETRQVFTKNTATSND
jgi:hypothetical protein